jgi:hypothetical protein
VRPRQGSHLSGEFLGLVIIRPPSHCGSGVRHTGEDGAILGDELARVVSLVRTRRLHAGMQRRSGAAPYRTQALEQLDLWWESVGPKQSFKTEVYRKIAINWCSG